MIDTSYVSDITDGEYFEVQSDGGIKFIADNYDGDGYITIPSSINGIKVTYIAERAFDGADNIKNVIIGDNIVRIDEFAFVGSSVEVINMADSVIEIGSSAFRACSNLFDIKLSRNISGIPSDCFRYCSKITNISLPSELNYIGEASFDNCSSLSFISIPNKVKKIGNNAFTSCVELSNIEFGTSLSYIGENAFADCSSLTEILLPYGFSEFGQYAFWQCDNLKSVTIPDTVKYIDYYAFASCDNLTNIYYSGTEKEFNEINADSEWNKNSPNITINYEVLIERYSNNEIASNGENPYREELRELEESINDHNTYVKIDDSDESFWYAVTAAQNLVRDYLKYPNSCSFPISSDAYVVKKNCFDYIVTGSVDAKNALGQVKNETWEASFTMEDYSGSRYKVENYSVSFDGFN